MMSIVRLGPGVAVGPPGNAVAHVPTRGSYALDADTHRFLLDVAAEESADLDLDRCSPDTARSIEALRNAGILTTDGDGTSNHSAATYVPALTDLVVRRRIAPFESVVAATGRLIGHVAISAFVYPAVAVLIALSMLWTIVIAPSETVIGTFINRPLVFISAVIALGTLRVTLHEAGHYAVAHRHGVHPTVGLGMYFTGPVAYVDLSPLDTHTRSVRLSADVAGLAVDGFLLVVVTALWLFTDWPVLTVVAVLLSGLALASFSPLEKSDAYWFARDLFGARELTASWDRPRRLLRAARTPSSHRSFARFLLAIYATSIVVGLATLVRWAPGTAEAVSHRTTSLVVPIGVSGIYLTLTVICVLIVRSRRQRARQTPAGRRCEPRGRLALPKDDG